VLTHKGVLKMTIFDWTMTILLTSVVLCCVLLLAATDSAHVSCLNAGYPDAYLSLNLDVYCLNVDGVVTGIVHKLN
jgi:hypothetical protein